MIPEKSIMVLHPDLFDVTAKDKDGIAVTRRYVNTLKPEPDRTDTLLVKKDRTWMVVQCKTQPMPDKVKKKWLEKYPSYCVGNMEKVVTYKRLHGPVSISILGIDDPITVYSE
jgi:hypothetical protein